MVRGKGEGSVYKDSFGSWRATIPLPDDPVTGKRRRKYLRGRTRADVVRKMRDAQVALAAPGARPSSSMTLRQWAETWLERDVAPRRKPATTADYRSKVDGHILPVIGGRRLGQIEPADVRAVHAAAAARGRSPATVAGVHRVLAACLSAAEREGLIMRNPARLVSPPPVRATSRPDSALTPDQARHYLSSREGHGDYARRLTSFTIGARQGEVLGITLEGLHLDAGVPSVELAWEVRRVTWAHGCGPRDTDGTWPCGHVRGADCPQRLAPVPGHLDGEAVHGGLWLLRPKTVSSWRHVALPPRLASAIRTHIDTYRPHRFLFEAAPGVPIDPRRDAREWAEGLASAHLPHVRLHSARSTAATMLLEADAPQRLIMEILGHTQAATTARYQRPSLAFQEGALTSIETALAG